MPNYRRPKVTGATVFFTVTLADRQSDLLIREIGLLRAAVRATKVERPFEIECWVVLPDHLHCIWTLPAGDRDFSTRWGAIKSRFTRAIKGRVGLNPTLRRSPSKVRQGDAGIWQRRFWEHHIRNEEDFAAHRQYCWFNPVKHGLVGHPSDWPFSSYHRDVRLGLVPQDWCGSSETGEPMVG